MHAKLELWVAGQPVRRYVLRPGQEFVVGRGKDVSILVDDSRVSRRHCALSLHSEGLFVTDLESRNGTFLDQRQVDPKIPLPVPNGAVLLLGDHQLHVDLVGFDDESRRVRLQDMELAAGLLPTDEFELLEEVGSGGVGRIWVARQKDPQRLVAVKLLRWELNPDAEDQRRFLREARLCHKIHSPHVVEVYDIRIVEGRPIIIMELIQGATAKDLLSDGALSVPEALKIGEDVARGLEAATAVGVVHRDVKPSNILLGPDGLAKLSDFGIAKDLRASSLTQTGFGMGSLPYAAPEQLVDAKEVDIRADIYSLGASLYQLITDHPTVVVRENILETIETVLRDPPVPLRTYRPDCPQAIASLIHRMLAKDREDRPQSAEEVAHALLEARGHFYPSWRPSPSTANGSEPVDETPDHLR